MSIMAPAVAEGQDGARIWTHRGGTSVTGRLVDVRNQLVTILVGSKRVDVPYLELSEADRGVVNNWLRLQTTVVSSGRFRPTMRLHKQQGSDGGGSFKVYINNVLQTSAVTDVESEILVPFYYDASLLTYRILESGYGKTVSSKDIADTSKGKSTKFQPLPKDPYLKALDELEQVSAMAATVLTWDAGKLLSAESQARLSAVMSADENLRKLTIIQDIQNGSRKLDLKGDDWMPTVPRAANPGRIKLALTRLTELLICAM